MIYKSMVELVGETPLVEATNIESSLDLKARVLMKIEGMNPGGSVKDRAALSMIQAAEASGALSKGGTIIEPTSGNTGIGLAWIGRLRGYRIIIVMPDSMSVERVNLLKALGAEVILTPGAGGMPAAIEKAREMQSEIHDSVILDQFGNDANAEAHIRTTGPEIWRDTNGRVDIFVAGVGTGGTLIGTSLFLKKCNPTIETVAVEPAASPVLSGGEKGPHKIQGIGAGFVPAIYNEDVVDKIIRITGQEAIDTARLLAKTEGVLTGFSGGAAMAAAISLANQEDNKGKVIVVILPDTGDRYLSTELYK